MKGLETLIALKEAGQLEVPMSIANWEEATEYIQGVAIDNKTILMKQGANGPYLFIEGLGNVFFRNEEAASKSEWNIVGAKRLRDRKGTPIQNGKIVLRAI